MGDARAGGGALRAMGRPKRERPKSGCQPTSEPNPKFEMKGGTGTVSAGFMRDSGALWRDRRDDQALRDRLAEDGYVMLRGALDPSAVRDAAATALASLRRSRPEAFASADDAAIDGDVLVAGAQNLGLLSMPEVAELPEVRHVLEHDSLFAWPTPSFTAIPMTSTTAPSLPNINGSEPSPAVSSRGYTSTACSSAAAGTTGSSHYGSR